MYSTREEKKGRPYSNLTVVQLLYHPGFLILTQMQKTVEGYLKVQVLML